MRWHDEHGHCVTRGGVRHVMGIAALHPSYGLILQTFHAAFLLKQIVPGPSSGNEFG
jgi:hypothetical protein